MALTISTGFVVDDAIVMIENISRFIEEGHSPMQAALEGSEQIGFTILSLTVSLIAVLIPLLFLGGIVGRLFREFAVTLAVTIVLSAVVSLTLTPMMCSRASCARGSASRGRFYQAFEARFQRMVDFYGRTLKVVLRYRTITLLVAFGTLVLTVVLYIIIPKGFLSRSGHGSHSGNFAGPAQTIFVSRQWLKSSRELGKIILQDPAVESLSSFIGADGTNTTLNSGRMSINLEASLAAQSSALRVIRRLDNESGEGTGGIDTATCSRCKTSPWMIALRARNISTRWKIRMQMS